MNLRAATMADAALLFEWANDPADRAASTNREPIGAVEHVKWLAKRLPAGGFYIAEEGDIPVGTARVDRVELDIGEISFSVDAGYRGKGLGQALVGKAALRATKELGLHFVRARAKVGNEPSLRTLAAAGFHTEIPHSRPAAGRLVDGPATAELERRWCEMTGMGAAAAVGSGTAALRLALLALGVGPGDEVIVPAYSCVALLNAPLSTGAVPVLADVLPDNWTIDPDDARRRLTRQTKAMIAVNLFGVPADVEALGHRVIEDCAHGPILGRGDLSVSSFYATKLVGAGMGGIVAGDPEEIDEVRRRRDYGDQEPDGRNLNDKITERSAGAAVGELAGLHENLAQRHRIALAYSRDLAEHPLEAYLSAPNATQGRVWYRYTPDLSNYTRGLTAAQVVERMKARGVHTEQPVWDLRGCRYWRDDLPVATEAFDQLISLPIYPGLTDSEQERVIRVLEEVLV